MFSAQYKNEMNETQKVVGKSVRLPLSPERLKRWEFVLGVKKISQQDALYAILDWFVEQEPLIQSMVLGQIPFDPEIQRMLILRLGDIPPQSSKKKFGGDFPKIAAEPMGDGPDKPPGKKPKGK